MVSKREIYEGLHRTVVGDRIKTRMNDEYSFAMFLVTFLESRLSFGLGWISTLSRNCFASYSLNS